VGCYLLSGYHEIPIKSKRREETAFSCHQGHLQFVKLPFGMSNAPATYQQSLMLF